MHNTILMTQGQLQFFGSYTLKTHLVILAAIVIAATVFDMREQRIPNWLVAIGMTVAVAYHALSPFGGGAWFALSGLVVGMAAFMPLYIKQAMGAGDVKLMAVVGAFLGAPAIVGAVLFTFIAGGVLALGITARKGMMSRLVANLHTMFMQRQSSATAGPRMNAESIGKMPYALAIAVGTAIQVFIMRG